MVWVLLEELRHWGLGSEVSEAKTGPSVFHCLKAVDKVADSVSYFSRALPACCLLPVTI